MSRPTVQEVKAQIDTHEAVCAERWLETIERIKRLEFFVVGGVGAILVLLLTIVFEKA
jgi:hypothetical protein